MIASTFIQYILGSIVLVYILLTMVWTMVFFKGYCIAEDIEERHEYEEKCRKDYEGYLRRKEEED